MNDKEFEIVSAITDPVLRRLIRIRGVDFDESFIAELISTHFNNKSVIGEPRLSDAMLIYLNESEAADRKKFRGDVLHVFKRFTTVIGDLPLADLKHAHACQFRDFLLSLGLKPVTVRKQTAILNAMLNMAFRYLDMDKLSPFRALRISGEQVTRPMRVITRELLFEVKHKLMNRFKPHKLVGLLQLNTGLRLSEPVYARVEDCVLDHKVPHIWVRRNDLSSRKTKSSIRSVPLVGISLFAAQRLVENAKNDGSEWLVPTYAHYHGSNTCSATMNKYLSDLDFRTHMFRHALIDRMKACNDIPTRLAESITGHSSGRSEYNNYGTVGYTLEQKLEVIKRVEI